MVLAHTPAVIGSWKVCFISGFSPSRIGTCLFLSFSIVFFVLKFFDARCLHFRFNRQSWVAVCLIVALLHTHALYERNEPSGLTPYVAVWVTTYIVGQIPLVRRVLVELATRMSLRLRGTLTPGHATGTVWLDTTCPNCWVLTFRIFGLRAPPA
jgi:hypothetical protein